MRAADPWLAGVLRRYAASFPAPRPGSFPQTLRVTIAGMIDQGSPSLREVASQLAISSRTLQRRLAEHGTTWRAELDAARCSVASAAGTHPVTIASLARQLGYSDPRSARRALRRWAKATGP
jgi:AraC-like DNA-binding protein